MNTIPKCLIVIGGPTGVGKTAVCLEIASKLGLEILSADSRQLYKELTIGTAKPSEEELNAIPHHFINHIGIQEEYSAGHYERDSLEKLNQLFKTHDQVILSGGTGLYIDAVVNGLDTFPDVPQEIIQGLEEEFQSNGLSALSQQLLELDPIYYEKVDIQNSRRVLRALSIIKISGKPFSSFLGQKKEKRPFQVKYILLNRKREILYQRINQRVDIMMENGLLDEVKSLVHFQNIKALETVGYKELFEFINGSITLDRAVELIKQNSRRYAKRQLTWFRRNPSWKTFHPEDLTSILNYINTKE